MRDCEEEMTRLKGSLVWDRITEKNAKIIGVRSEFDDYETKRFYYKLENVELSPDYPSGWRHSGEVEKVRKK